MGPAPELKEYEPFLVSWIGKCKKLGFLVSKKKGLLERVQNIVISVKLVKERNKKIGN